jgi:single-stranded-DNA-specific exonuclease
VTQERYIVRSENSVNRFEFSRGRNGLQSRKVTVKQFLDAKGEEQALAIAQAVGLSLITAKILVSRGITTTSSAKAYLAPSFRNDLPNPADLKNIDQAAKLLLQATKDRKSIVVFSDFDVDGLTAGAQLFVFLRQLGAQVRHYTPNRFDEGYGLSIEAVRGLAASGADLLVTVDCGISDHREIALAKKLGLTTLIIDHHLPHGLPDADVIVDPAQDGCSFRDYQLAAAGLVWMLLIVLRSKLRDDPAFAKLSIPEPKDFLDLAALGTICDMVPLTALNRLIAHRGIEAVLRTRRPGLTALRQVAGVYDNPRFGSGHVSFALGPRINAAGRLGDDKEAFELLTTEDSKRAKVLAKKIDQLNTQRRQEEERVKEACLEQLNRAPELVERSALALFGTEYHIGVIGIVAQRLVEQFHIPAAVMAPGQEFIDGKAVPVIKGSVRGIPGFHVADALESLKDCLIGCGGHAQAGGFSVSYEQLEAFREGFVARAEEVLTQEHLVPKLEADIEVALIDLDFKLADELSKLAPFGVGNPSPLLVCRDVLIDTVTSLSGGHLRLRVSDGRYMCGGVAWGFQGHPLLRKGMRVGLAFHPEINCYKGVSSVQLNIKEVWE